MTVAVSLWLVLSQAPYQYPPPLPGFVAYDNRQSMVARIMALDAQLRTPAPDWAAPVVGIGLGISAVTFGLTAYGLATNAGPVATIFMVLGTMLGIVTGIAGITAGFVGHAEALRRADTEARRERLMRELELKSRDGP